MKSHADNIYRVLHKKGLLRKSVWNWRRYTWGKVKPLTEQSLFDAMAECFTKPEQNWSLKPTHLIVHPSWIGTGTLNNYLRGNRPELIICDDLEP